MFFDVAETPAVEVTIPSGMAGARATLREMARLAREYSKHPRIRQTAELIVAPLPGKQFRAEAVAIFDEVRNAIRYTRDAHHFETLSTPVRVLDVRVGDCDDMATLLAALLLSVGHPVRFVAIGQSRGEVSHVYLETKIGPHWLALDPTEPMPAGWSADYATRIVQDI